MTRTAEHNAGRWTVGASVRDSMHSFECRSIDRAHMLLTATQRLYAAVNLANDINTKRIDQLMARLNRQRRGTRA